MDLRQVTRTVIGVGAGRRDVYYTLPRTTEPPWRHISTHSLPKECPAGSGKKYALDLNDIFAFKFPDGNNIPPSLRRPPDTEEGESWVMLLEVGLLLAVSNAVLLGGNMDVIGLTSRS
jgi:hypothetical protein